jgi:NAD(P)-dependent dehydrogenase (short-subunit alcohol dehydrogenase family)
MKTALIVGASRGLGLGLVTELSQRGWNVVATARKPEQAAPLQALARRSKGIELEQIDVDSPGDLDGLAGRLAGRRFDLLFVNAGIIGPAHGSIEQVTPAELAQLMQTNALAPIRIATRLLPLVVDGGTVAFMSSILGSVAGNQSGGYDLYRISKASLNTLARGFVATTAKDRDVTVLNLHPGWVRTDMGGPGATLGVEESVRGLADVLESRHSARHLYLDYQGKEIPW